MSEELEDKMVEFMRPMFGDMAERTIQKQMEKLQIMRGDLSYEEYKKVADSISDLCRHMAGEAIARKIHDGLMDIIKTAK